MRKSFRRRSQVAGDSQKHFYPGTIFRVRIKTKGDSLVIVDQQGIYHCPSHFGIISFKNLFRISLPDLRFRFTDQLNAFGIYQLLMPVNDH